MQSFAKRLISNQLFYVLMIVLTIVCTIHTTHHDLDFKVFYRTGAQVLAHNFDFYNTVRDGGWTYRYGPSFALFMAPLALLSLSTAQLLWGLFSALSVLLGWFCSENALARRLGAAVRSPGVRLLTLVMALDVIARNADQGNVNAFMFCTIAVALDLSDRGRNVSAGIVAGFGAMTKVYPGGLAMYFLFARRWKAFWATTIATLLWTFGLPALVFGPGEMKHQILTWAAVLQDKSYYPFFKYINQAPYSVFWRVFDSQAVGQIATLIFLVVATATYLWWFRQKSDLLLLLAGISFPLIVLTCVFTEYHIITIPVLMAGNFFLLNGRFNRGEKAVYWIRFGFVHLAVLTIAGRALTETIGFYGNYLFGLMILLLLIASSLKRQPLGVSL